MDKGLEARLRNTVAIALDAELACAPGELLALAGPSGSGKSTILRSIAGLFHPTNGYVRIGGELWYAPDQGIDLKPRERHVGFVFQSYALFPHLTALANVMEALSHEPRAEREQRARRLLARVHLAGLEDRKPAMLSGGEQQRVAVARALAREPKVLLLDEPFSAVDRYTRERLYTELAELRRELDMPVVLVTHDLDEAVMLADRMTILHRGHTLQSGPPLEVISHPQDATVARLVGLKNIFAGEIAEHRSETTLIRWRNRLVEARLQPAFPPGTQVAWVVPSAAVRLHLLAHPIRSENQNPVDGIVVSMVTLGDNMVVTLHIDGDAALPLTFSLPIHVARRNGVSDRKTVRASLLTEGIHLMPAAATPADFDYRTDGSGKL